MRPIRCLLNKHVWKHIRDGLWVNGRAVSHICIRCGSTRYAAE